MFVAFDFNQQSLPTEASFNTCVRMEISLETQESPILLHFEMEKCAGMCSVWGREVLVSLMENWDIYIRL